MNTKCGLIASSCLALTFGLANAATTISTATKGPGGSFSVDNGGTITGTGSVTSGTAGTLVMSFSVVGMDLSSEFGPTATSVGFDFTVTYTANTGTSTLVQPEMLGLIIIK